MISYGEQLMKAFLDEMLRGFKYIDNWKPPWLKASTGRHFELDRYYPELKAGFEFQGEQHFQDEKQIRRDKYKWQLCKEQDIEVILIDTSDLHSGSLRYRVNRATRAFRMSLAPQDRKQVKNLTNSNKLKQLNQEAREYRRLIRRQYPDSGSAHQRWGRKRIGLKYDPRRYQGQGHAKTKL